MFTIITKNKLFPLQVLIFAAFVVFILFKWQGNIIFNLWDEGFLWYGAQRVMLGEVPALDFMSYDPGRYYWSAALMSLWGDNGIMALRGAVAIFQTIGLFVGLLLIARAAKKQNLFYLLLAAITLVVWMFPNFRLFDISLSILLIGVLTFLVQNPTIKRYFFTGLCVGLVAVFGRNHGVYGIVGSIGVMFWLNIKRGPAAAARDQKMDLAAAMPDQLDRRAQGVQGRRLQFGVVVFGNDQDAHVRALASLDDLGFR